MSAPTSVLDVALDVRVEHGMRMRVQHGTHEVTARVGWLGGRFHQLRCEEPLVAARGDRLVVRAVGAPDVLARGVVLDPRARKHGPSNDLLVRLTRLERGEDADAEDVREVVAPPLDADALALEARYREAGAAPPDDAELDEAGRAALFALREAGRVVRLGKGRHIHVDALDAYRAAHAARS